MKFFRQPRRSKNSALLMLLVFMFSTLNPTISFAISSGPGQPELEGFSPIGVDNMVDLSTGDFSYNLPLLTVPGPNGGYPINMSYSAQPGMEEAASWVGLGWSLNPGVVNREVRGLPDDFAGQEVIKKKTYKPNQTINFNIAVKDIEALGLNLDKITSARNLKAGGNLNFMYNSYKGFDVRAGLGFSAIESGEAAGEGQAVPIGLVDSTGEGSGPTCMPTSERMAKAEVVKESEDALSSIDLENYSDNLEKVDRNYSGLGRIGAGIQQVSPYLFGFAASRSTLNMPFDHPIGNFSFGMNVKTGLSVFSITADVQFDVYYSRQQVLDETIEVPAYGYMNHHLNYRREESGLTDFSRENQAKLTPDINTIPVPNFTYDVFHVSGQGIGGKARAYRNEVAMLTEPKSKSYSGDLGLGLEFNLNFNELKGGVNPRASYTQSESGEWTSGADALGLYRTEASFVQALVPGAEYSYFKFGGELTAPSNENTAHTDQSLMRFGMKTGFGLKSIQPVLRNALTSSKTTSLNAINGFRLNRERRAKMFHVFRESEADDYYAWDRQVYDLIAQDTVVVSRHSNINDPEGKLIGEVRVTGANGLNYVYGIPAKNHVQKQNVFSKWAVTQVEGNLDEIPKTIGYSRRDNSLNNNQGEDELFSSTETPEHAHSFLLTEILSEDYRDISEDGPTPDDIGNYTAFDYAVVKNFKSKSPLEGANLIIGAFSNTGDDKATITYFEKDMYYLRSVKTKTHIAVFTLNDTARSDSYGVSGENDNTGNGADAYKLERIDLYNLAEYEENPSTAVPIKSVHFTMDYSLCKKSGGTGKLTLKKLWFSSGGELTQNSLSPYEFFYGESGNRHNPDYNPNFIDRWGTYQENDDNPFDANLIYPYTQQTNREIADSNASAWSLKEIKLPTGGKIKVSYEADDYAWVQNKSAMQMYEILGFVDKDYADPFTVSPTSDMADDNLWMIIKLPEAVPQTEDLSKYFGGVTQTYFKAFTRLKKFPLGANKPDASSLFNNSDWAWDYVDGYLNLDLAHTKINTHEGAMTDEIAVKVKRTGRDHPIKKAAWIELRLNRQDLFRDSGIDLTNFDKISSGMLTTLSTILGKIFNFAEGDPFFLKAETLNWGQHIGLKADSKPASVVRLKSPLSKVGGGHRVARIEISDEWSAMGGASTYSYGQKYLYNDPVTGASYGVAQYEPTTGGEENPFKLPEQYSSVASGLELFQDDYLTVDLPIGEAFYPSATVVYSKVRVENIANETVTTSGAGINIHEFYTAKDYPTLTSKTDLRKVNDSEAAKIIAFIGGKNYFEPGFSQGFKVELNDMHGKQKRTATYAATADLSKDAPVQETRYVYHTKDGYSPYKANRLENDVLVYYGDGYSENAEIGVNQDTYFDLKETKTWSISGAIEGNLATVFLLIPIPLPSIIPNIDYNYSSTRWVSMTKVVEKTGVLSKVITSRDGASVEQEYLGFDYDTGQPVLASSTTPFADKTYSYSQLAKWYYSDLTGKYQNLGLVFKGENVAMYQNFFHRGDVIMDSDGDKYWIIIDDSGIISYYDKTGTQQSLVGAETYKVVESGYANRLAEAAGSIQTIGNPVADLKENFSLFKAYNQLSIAARSSVTVKDCEDNSVYNLTIQSDIDTYYGCPPRANCVDNKAVVIKFEGLNNVCSNDVMNAVFPYDGILTNPTSLNLYYLGDNRIMGVEPNGKKHFGVVQGGNATWYGVYDIGDCFDFCISGVLNSSFMAYSDTLRSFEDFEGTATGITNNPYYYNKRGIFSPTKSFFLPTPRTQASSGDYHFTTNIAADGEYESYGRLGKGLENKNWKEATEIVKMDHNGMVVEENNALGIPTAALYGYNRSLPIAIAQNASYAELAFDGFEEHGATYNASKKDNHLVFVSGVSLSSEAHSGDYGITLSSSTATSAKPDLETGKEYLAMIWHKVGSGGSLQAYHNGSYVDAEAVTGNIEGWELLQVRFTAASGSAPIKLLGSGAVFDDIRVQPFNSSMSCFVYDKRTHQLIAELDANHFATFYNYDKDRVLVQVKKETIRGVKTIQSTQRSMSQAN